MGERTSVQVDPLCKAMRAKVSLFSGVPFSSSVPTGAGEGKALLHPLSFSISTELELLYLPKLIRTTPLRVFGLGASEDCYASLQAQLAESPPRRAVRVLSYIKSIIEAKGAYKRLVRINTRGLPCTMTWGGVVRLIGGGYVSWGRGGSVPFWRGQRATPLPLHLCEEGKW